MYFGTGTYMEAQRSLLFVGTWSINTLFSTVLDGQFLDKTTWILRPTGIEP